MEAPQGQAALFLGFVSLSNASPMFGTMTDILHQRLGWFQRDVDNAELIRVLITSDLIAFCFVSWDKANETSNPFSPSDFL